MAYSDSMNLKMKIRLNDRDVEVKIGKGYFSVDPKELKVGQRLRAEMIFPDTVYSTTIFNQIGG